MCVCLRRSHIGTHCMGATNGGSATTGSAKVGAGGGPEGGTRVAACRCAVSAPLGKFTFKSAWNAGRAEAGRGPGPWSPAWVACCTGRPADSYRTGCTRIRPCLILIAKPHLPLC